MKADQEEQVLGRGLRTGIHVDERPARPVGPVGGGRPGVELEGGEVRRPHQGRCPVEDGVALGLALVGGLVAPLREPVGRAGRDRLLPEALRAGAVRVAVHVHRPVVQVGQHPRGDPGVVGEQLPLGHRRRVVVPTGEQHLVEVGDLQGATLQLPRPVGTELGQGPERTLVHRIEADAAHAGVCDLGGSVRGSVAVPHQVGFRRHLLVGAAAQHRPRVRLGVPPLHGVVVALVEQQPLGLAAAVPTTLAHEDEAPSQLLGVDVEVQRAVGELPTGVGTVGWLPRAAVPDDDVAAAVLARRDHALEVGVLDGVVLDLHGQPARSGIQGRPLRHGPAEEGPVELQAQVVVQAGGAVALDHEPETIGSNRRRRRAGRLRCAVEVPLGVVVLQSGAAVVGGHRRAPSWAVRRCPTRCGPRSDSPSAPRGNGWRWRSTPCARPCPRKPCSSTS